MLDVQWIHWSIEIMMIALSLTHTHTHTHIDQTDGDGLVLWLVLMRFASRQLLSTYDIDTNVPKGTEPHNTCLSLVYCWLRIRFRSVRPCLFDYPNVYIGDKVLFRAHFCVDRRSFYYCIVRCIELESRSSLDHTHTHTQELMPTFGDNGIFLYIGRTQCRFPRFRLIHWNLFSIPFNWPIGHICFNWF